MESKQRNSLMDILKAIGIISVVIGHCCYEIPIAQTGVSVGEFVYSYHLMVFFFTAGFLFKKERADQAEAFIGKRLLQLVSLYILYCALLSCLHNVLLANGIISGTDYYEAKGVLISVVNGIIFQFTEEMLGPFWFLPMFFVGLALFAVAFRWAEKGRHPAIRHMMVVAVFAAAALYANIHEIKWRYHIQISLLAVPVLYMGFYCKQYWAKLEKWITWYGTLGSALAVFGILSTRIGIVELSIDEIVHPALFYPVTILGLYFCLGLGKLLDRAKFSRKIFAGIGRNSFHIMALHCLGFKLVDLAYSRAHGITDVETISRFPHSEYGLCWSYLFVGILFPLLVVGVGRTGKRLLKSWKGEAEKWRANREIS